MNYRFHLRSRFELFKSNSEWQETLTVREFVPEETAVLLCDVWDRHWCPAATRRCDVIAQRIATLVEAVRQRGTQVIHAPSDCMDFYKDYPQYQRMHNITRVAPFKTQDILEGPLPIDDSDGGCDGDDAPPTWHKAWTRQHPAITIADNDAITEDGAEVYSLLREKKIKTLCILGVHTNMCVLGRSFGIRQMTRWGVPCVLVRDLTDAMYNPKLAPFVSHEEGTELVVQHIEKFWCPTITSDDLMR